MCAELSCTHSLYYLHERKRILKSAKVTIDSASSEVVSFSWQPAMDERESLLLDARNQAQYSVVIRREKLVILISETILYLCHLSFKQSVYVYNSGFYYMLVLLSVLCYLV